MGMPLLNMRLYVEDKSTLIEESRRILFWPLVLVAFGAALTRSNDTAMADTFSLAVGNSNLLRLPWRFGGHLRYVAQLT